MQAIVSTSAAVCVALLQGPRYGRDIIRLLSARGRGAVNPRPGTVYGAFEALLRKGYVRHWRVVPGGRRGARARRYYELTTKGMAAAQRQREALSRLLGPPPPRHSTAEARLMGERVRRAAEVSAFASRLRREVRRAEGRPW